MCAFNRDKKRSWSIANQDDSIQNEPSFDQTALRRHHGSSSRESDLPAPKFRGDIGLGQPGFVRESALLVDDSVDVEILPQAYNFTSYDESPLLGNLSSTWSPPFNERADGLALLVQSPLASTDHVSDSCSTFSTGLTSNPTPTFLGDIPVEVCYGTVSVT